MYRCMTCDERRKGAPLFIPLGEVAEDIGVCPKCALAIRSYNTLAALAVDEYAEKERGESPDCDDPDCAEKENEAEARSIARQVWAKDGEVEIDDDAGVSMAFTDPDGDPTGAYVQAWVFVEFTANSANGAR